VKSRLSRENMMGGEERGGEEMGRGGS